MAKRQHLRVWRSEGVSRSRREKRRAGTKREQMGLQREQHAKGATDGFAKGAADGFFGGKKAS